MSGTRRGRPCAVSPKPSQYVRSITREGKGVLLEESTGAKTTRPVGPCVCPEEAPHMSQTQQHDTSYEAVAKEIFAHGEVPDGYRGKKARVGFALLNSEIVIVADCGYFRAGLAEAHTPQQALGLLREHPNASHISVFEN